MDRTEQHVLKYLQYLGFSNIAYEPDGQVPPDFLIEGQCAVEVRKLNQQVATPTGLRGVEELAIPLIRTVRSVLDSFGPSRDGLSWYVSYTFKRPIPPRKEVENALRSVLEWLLSGPIEAMEDGKHIQVTPTLGIRVYRAGRIYSSLFVLGGYVDRDSGGWIVSEVARNVAVCVAEKTHKVAHVRSKYPKWWLVLVDAIGYGLDEYDREQLREILKLDHSWDKIILVNPQDYTQAFEL